MKCIQVLNKHQLEIYLRSKSKQKAKMASLLVLARIATLMAPCYVWYQIKMAQLAAQPQEENHEDEDQGSKDKSH